MTDSDRNDSAEAEPSLEAAIDRLRLAADEGKADAMYQLGAAYAQGRGVQRNLTEAARWFHAAAKRGHAKAKTSIAYLYATGQGVRHDQRLAFIFLSEASAAGDPQATDMLFKLRRKMQPVHIREAEKHLRERPVM